MWRILNSRFLDHKKTPWTIDKAVNGLYSKLEMAVDKLAWLWLTTSTIAEISTPKQQSKQHDYSSTQSSLLLCLYYVDDWMNRSFS